MQHVEPLEARQFLSVQTESDLPSALTTTAAGAQEIVYSPPVIINSGGVYSGNWESLDADIPAVSIWTSEPVIIINSTIRSRGDCIEVLAQSADVTIENTRGYGLNPMIEGRYVGRFLDVDGFSNINVRNNYLESTGGIYVAGYSGRSTPLKTIKVIGNVALNIDGRASDGNGGWLPGAMDPDECRQFFQSNGAHRLVDAEVAWNQVINQDGKSRVEESINLFETSGQSRSPFRIHNNYIQGAYPNDRTDALDYAGGGIMIDLNSSYIHVYDNQVVGTLQIGIGIAGGSHNRVYDNRVISAGGAIYSNVGIYIWDFYGEMGTRGSGRFVDNIGWGNVVGFVNADGVRNDWWIADDAAAAVWEADNIHYEGKVTNKTEMDEWTLWQAKLEEAGTVLGPQA